MKNNINKDFENFDKFAKICTNPHCLIEYKSEEYFNLNNKCSTCGGELKLKKIVQKDI